MTYTSHPIQPKRGTQHMRATFSALCSIALACALAGCEAEEKVQITAEDANFEKSLKEQLVQARAGTVIELPEGSFQIQSSLTLTESGVTIRGAGMDKTILSFKGQKSGAEGLTVSGSDFVIEDLAIEDTKGDALKINGAKNVTIRRVRTEWTNGPDEDNGAYGVYPVQCENVLIEESVAIGASDAGIYVGQSKNIIVRKNRAEFNVAGIEIENSTFADVHDNVATNNTGGILVFDLPDLPVQGGQNTRIFKNDISKNNTDNFAPSGNIVGKVPAGTGLMILANDNIEVFENKIADNQTVNILLASYFITETEIKDKDYDPIPEKIYIHNNEISGGGTDPTGGSAFQSKKVITALSFMLDDPWPDVLYDGIVPEKYAGETKGRLPPERAICLENNGDATFANIDAANDFANISKDKSAHECSHERLQAVNLPND